MAKSFIREIDHNYKGLKKLIEFLGKSDPYVKVGVLGDSTWSPGSGAPVDNVGLATVHEFGAPDQGIPERSFIRSTYEKNREAYAQMILKLLERVVELKMTPERALGLVGARVANDMKNAVKNGPGIPPPLKQATIDRKGSSRPLVDTGQMVNSITWAVVEGGQRTKESGPAKPVEREASK